MNKDELLVCGVCGKKTTPTKVEQENVRFVRTHDEIKSMSIQFMEVNQCNKCKSPRSKDFIIQAYSPSKKLEVTVTELEYIRKANDNHAGYIMMDIDNFEHLLNCMCNQKFISEQGQKDKKEWQDIIDKAYHAARGLLSIPRTTDELSGVSEIAKQDTIFKIDAMPLPVLNSKHTLSINELIGTNSITTDTVILRDKGWMIEFKLKDRKYVCNINGYERELLEEFGYRQVDKIQHVAMTGTSTEIVLAEEERISK